MRAHFTVKDLVRIRICYEREKSTLRWHGLHVRCRIGTALAQNINRAKRQTAAFEACPLFSEVQSSFFPIRDQSWKRFHGVIKHFYGFGPQAKMRVCRHHMEGAFAFYECNNVIGNDPVALPGEGRCGRGLSRPHLANKRNTSIFESHGTGMQADDTAQTQDKSQN